MSFSDRLRQARKRQGLTQEELGKKSGLSTYTIQRYEYGKLNPKKDTVAKLATALNLGYDYTKSGEPYFTLSLIPYQVQNMKMPKILTKNSTEMQ